MGGFLRLTETELAELDDSELIEYVVGARAAGAPEEAGMALKIFAFGMEEPVRAFVRSRLRDQGDSAVDEIVGRSLESSLGSIESLAGSTPQEARAFVFKIARRRIADFHRKGRPPVSSLDDDPGGTAPVPDGLRVADESGEVETSILIEELLAELRDDHRAVVELNVLSGYSARETADLVASRNGAGPDDSMTEQNVHQIASRFRKELRSRLEADVNTVSG
jgi:RNA polymerase sigma factor (sigma-70 family)